MAAELSELIDRVADYSLRPHDPPRWMGQDLESVDWEKGILINGLLATDTRVDDARAHVERAIETQTGAGQFAYGSLGPKRLDWDVPWQQSTYTSIADPVIPGHGVLDFYRRTGEERYLEAAERQYEFLQRIERTTEGGIPQRREALELWVDALYMVPPFLARYGVAADEGAALEDAVHQFELQRKHLRDPQTGLWRQTWLETPNSYPQSTLWSRGNGWVTTGLVDTIDHLPIDHPGRETLAEYLRELCDRVLPYQDRTGFWPNILDDPTSWLEVSGTLMFAYSFMKGIELGLLEEDRYREPAADAMEICKGVVDHEGAVRRVAKVPGGPGAPPGTTLHGQGFFLLAASRFL